METSSLPTTMDKGFRQSEYQTHISLKHLLCGLNAIHTVQIQGKSLKF